MPILSKSFLPVLALLFSLISCQNAPQTEAAQVTPPAMEEIKYTPASKEGAQAYLVKEGTIEWVGTKTVSKSKHEGTISVQSGELLVNNGQLVSGKVLIDMNSIAVTDIKDPGERRDLESHLKDADFFEVNQYPLATFVFEEVLPNTTPEFNWVLVGQLTMKDKTIPVNIPIKMTLQGETLRAESAAFPINRTKWGVSFHSGVLGTVKDKMIDDTVPIRLKITAKSVSKQK